MRRLFYQVYDRNMANLKNPFNSSETSSFQIQLYCFSPNMLRVAALAYSVVASTLFAQISLFLLLNPLFTRLPLPHFGHLSSLSMLLFYTAYRFLAMPRKRIAVEHVIALVKRFQILSERYRNRRKRFSLRFSLIAGICNFEQLSYFRKRPNAFLHLKKWQGIATRYTKNVSSFVAAVQISVLQFDLKFIDDTI